MQSRTQLTLEELEGAEWFSHVGEPRDGPYIVLKKWEDAIDSCRSIQWENLCLEAANQYCARLRANALARFSDWNNIVKEIKPITVPLVKRKIASIVADKSLPKEFEAQVQWDVLHLAMEAEYADVYPPGFYASQAFWYVNGRFPCGWDGAFPDGRLVLF